MRLIELHKVSIEILVLQLFMQCLENGCFNAHYRIFKFSTFGVVLLLNDATNWKPAITFHKIRVQTMAFLFLVWLVLFVSICSIPAFLFDVCISLFLFLFLFCCSLTEYGCFNWMVISKTSETTHHLEVSTTLLHLKSFHFPWRKLRKNDNLRMKHENVMEWNGMKEKKQMKHECKMWSNEKYSSTNVRYSFV